MGRKKKKQLKPWCWYPFARKTYESQKKVVFYFTVVKLAQALHQRARGVNIYGFRFPSPYTPVRMSLFAQRPFAIIIRRTYTLFALFPALLIVYIMLNVFLLSNTYK